MKKTCQRACTCQMCGIIHPTNVKVSVYTKRWKWLTEILENN